MRVHFTDRFLASVKAKDVAQVEHFDEVAKGLSIRVSARSKTWFLHYTGNDGRRARVRLGHYPMMTLAAARGAALEARASLEDGADPRAKGPGPVTVAALVDAYLVKRVRNLRSAKNVEGRFRNDIVPTIGNVPLVSLHRRDVHRCVDAVLARGAPIAANHVLQDLKAMCRWALGRGDLDSDPTAGMRMPSPIKTRERALSEDEIAILWHALPTALAKSIDAQRILKLCLITGQRVGEVTGIARSELDLDRRVWGLPASRSKNKHAHTIPLSAMAIAILKDAMADAGDRARLFDITAKRVSRLADEIQEAVGIEHWVPHDLRRSVLTHLARFGVEPIVLSTIANHRTGTKAGVTLGVYVQYHFTNEARRALDLWADRLAALVGDKPAAKVIPIRAR